MTAEVLTAVASLGTLIVITATAIAAFVQLRHLGTSNRLMVLNDFRQAYEQPEMAAALAALPAVIERLKDPEARREILGPVSPLWARPVFPIMRLFEILGSYTNRKIVSRELLCDLWSPVILASWNEAAPLIAVLRRKSGPALFENWEAIAVLSQHWLDQERGTYPKRLPRMKLIDPWSVDDAQPSAKTEP